MTHDTPSSIPVEAVPSARRPRGPRPWTGLWAQTGTALRALVAATLVLGVVYPVAIWAVARVVMPDRAAGQPVSDSTGEVVGSTLIGQPFTPRVAPDLFHSRPSAGGYDPLATAPSNVGPSDPGLVRAIERRRERVAATEGVDPGQVPADAVTASGSGVDPHISPEYAALQVPRVAEQQGLSEDEVRALVEEHTSGRSLGFLGEPGVNVLALNLAVLAAG